MYISNNKEIFHKTVYSELYEYPKRYQYISKERPLISVMSMKFFETLRDSRGGDSELKRILKVLNQHLAKVKNGQERNAIVRDLQVALWNMGVMRNAENL